MSIFELLHPQLSWMLSNWWAIPLAVLAGVLLWFTFSYLFLVRSYIVVDGKLHVKHGKWGRWLDLEEHLREEHPEEWERMQRGKEDGS